ncbi:spinster family MFS transporter [Tsuneonella rigui]|jgi:predicted MFS family arabinose efflux permease|uniref:spinster family MFS transporter n=1 Tax=Tsuneonella rigui TaxID=1708790 RepID=UPI000F7E9385|nr:MFS transporter [Tsuneonella rigui]
MSRLRRHSPALALTLLTMIGTIGFIDRIVVNALVEPLKAEFGLSDAQIGLLGLAYSALNIVLGVGIARLAEHRRRLTFTTIGTLLWSVAATASGFVQGWHQLLAARIAVGVGEAVGLPANQSVISDYYPPHRRASAMSILLLSAPLGALIGLGLGGVVAQHWGWRWAFIVTGLPGILLAALVWLFVKEPPRGAHDGEIDHAVPGVGAVLKRLLSLPAARHLVMGSALASLVGFGLIAFLSALMTRRFGLPVGEAGLFTALIASLPAAVSVALGGTIADRLAPRVRASHALVPGLCLLAAAPLYVIAMTRGDLMPFAVFTALSTLLQFTFLGPTAGSLQNMLHPRMRATGHAFTNIFTGLVGGLGPVLVGWMSDKLSAAGYASDIALGYGMAGCGLVSLWAAAHYLLAARTLEGDLAKVREGRA